MDTLERADVSRPGATRRADVAQRTAPQRVTVAATAAGPDDGPAQRKRTAARVMLAADAATVTIGLAATLLVRPHGTLAAGHLALALAALPVWVIALAGARRAAPRPTAEGRQILRATVITVTFLLALTAAIQFDGLSRSWLLAMGVVVPSLVTIGRLLARRLLAGRVEADRVLVIGTDPHAIALAHAAQRRPELGIDPVGFVGPDDLGRRAGCSWLGGYDQIDAALRSTRANGVIISLASVPPQDVNRLVRRMADRGVSVSLAPGLRDIDARRCRARDLDDHAVVEVVGPNRSGWRAAAKRSFDVAAAVLALVVSLPLTLLVAVAIKVTSPGPVVFAQERVGRDGRTFRILKFRTMVADAEARKAELVAQNEADGPMFKMARDPRVTKVGSILRKLSIDEIPQFVNVLKGEMSIVGPRPALASEVAQWSDDVHGRLRVLPGITGMWQVSGRSDTSFEEYKRLDLYYVDNWTLAHDLRIMARTVPAVLAKRGAC